MSLPADALPPVAGGSSVVVDTDSSVAIASRAMVKRAVQTSCRLTIYVSGVIAYDAPLFTTDGQFTRISTTPLIPSGPLTVDYIITCQGGSIDLTLRAFVIVVIDPPPPTTTTQPPPETTSAPLPTTTGFGNQTNPLRHRQPIPRRLPMHEF
jgi:hypothetical protein